MIRALHPIAGAVGMATIATFWLSTVAAEAFDGPATILAVKTAILWGLLVLVPCVVFLQAHAAAGDFGAASPSCRGSSCWRAP